MAERKSSRIVPWRQKRKSLRDRLSRAAWISAAREALIAGGVARVKVDPLAKSLGVTTGTFYWEFKNRRSLLDALLKHWETTNSAAFFEAIASAGDDPDAQFDKFARVWIDERDYSPGYDSAVREWARISPAVAAAVRRVDDRRIKLLHKIFLRRGEPDPHAFVRARVAYFHQVGYYAMHIVESAKTRRDLFPIYLAILKGDASG